MKKEIILMLLLGAYLCVSAQNRHLVKGKVVDEENHPVSYTNIGLEGTYYGTASDVEGFFELPVSEDLAGLNVFFSAVGYKNRTLPVATLFDKDFHVIRLESQSYSIEDVEVNAQSMVLYRILRTASENVPRNFSQGPFTMQCIYEHEKQVEGGDSCRITARVALYDETGYADPSLENAFKSRKYTFSDIKKNCSSYLLSDGMTNMDEVIELDLARSVSALLNPVNLDRFVLNQEEDAILGGIDVWVIGFNLAEPGLVGSGDYYASRFEGKIYINKNNYEIKKIEGWITSGQQNRLGRSLAVTPKSEKPLQDVMYDFRVNYNTEGLEFITLHKNYTQAGQSTTENSLLVVNEKNTGNNTPISTRDYFVEE
jgi:hypothetical protein